MKKLCYNCTHIDIDAGWGGTDVTPSDEPTLRCGLSHWTFFPRYGSASGESLGLCLERAETCPDFEPANHINRNA